MKQKKKNFLEKIVKKDYNNELENILEDKNYDENVKSILLSILYKIEVAYKDLQTVKKDIENQEEYKANLLDIIKNQCNQIKIVRMSDEKHKIPENKTYIIDKEKKEIISYPIERKLLYAINKIAKRDKIIKDDYFLVNETLSDLINVGNNINEVEPLRDFNGYSWTVVPQEVESIEHNLIYQNLRIIVGYEFLEKWIKNNEYIIDYYDLFMEKLENNYGKANKNKIIDLLAEISILLSLKFNNDKIDELKKIKIDIEQELEKMKDRQQYIENITKKKLKLEKNIKKIDSTINDKNLLKKEYEKRNNKLPLDKKIFSMRILSKIMNEEREEDIKELEKLNKIINPQNFIKYKKELEEKYKYLKIVDIEDRQSKLETLNIEFQKLFLDILKIDVNKSETKQEIEKIIYNFRYYLLLPYNYEKSIKDVDKLQRKIIEVTNMIIDKAIDLKVIEKISDDKKTNYEILKNMFNVRIIKLEDAYLKIIKEDDKYFVQIFDENIFEEKVEISKPKDLDIKPEKKISIWC